MVNSLPSPICPLLDLNKSEVSPRLSWAGLSFWVGLLSPLCSRCGRSGARGVREFTGLGTGDFHGASGFRHSWTQGMGSLLPSSSNEGYDWPSFGCSSPFQRGRVLWLAGSGSHVKPSSRRVSQPQQREGRRVISPRGVAGQNLHLQPYTTHYLSPNLAWHPQTPLIGWRTLLCYPFLSFTWLSGWESLQEHIKV